MDNRSNNCKSFIPIDYFILISFLKKDSGIPNQSPILYVAGDNFEHMILLPATHQFAHSTRNIFTYQHVKMKKAQILKEKKVEHA